MIRQPNADVETPKFLQKAVVEVCLKKEAGERIYGCSPLVKSMKKN